MSPVLLLAAQAVVILLLLVDVTVAVRARSASGRILAVDLASVLFACFLLLFGYAKRSSHHLDAALVVALLGFVATLRLARYLAGREDAG